MLEFKNLVLNLGDKKIIDIASHSIETPQVIGIVGKNGAGKTSLFNTLCGTYKFSGEILWQGSVLKPYTIAYLETSNFFYPFMTCSEYLSFFNPNFLDLKKMADFLELPLNEYVDTFSTGMKKKLALLGIVSLDRPILILDEPFNGLDLESVEKIYLFIEFLKQRKQTLLISSHILETLTHTCDTIIGLENGIVSFSYARPHFPELVQKIRTAIQINTPF